MDILELADYYIIDLGGHLLQLMTAQIYFTIQIGLN